MSLPTRVDLKVDAYSRSSAGKSFQADSSGEQPRRAEWVWRLRRRL